MVKNLSRYIDLKLRIKRVICVLENNRKEKKKDILIGFTQFLCFLAFKVNIRKEGNLTLYLVGACDSTKMN